MGQLTMFGLVLAQC